MIIIMNRGIQITRKKPEITVIIPRHKYIISDFND